MARRTRDESSTTATSTEEAATTAQEAPVTVTDESTTEAATSAAESTTESTETAAPAAEKAPEAPIDLSGFIAKVDEAVAGRDEVSGDVAEGLITAAQAEYRTLDGVKAKNAAKKLVEERMREAMNQRDISSARAYMLVSDNLTAGASGSKADKTPADPTEAFVQRLATLRLAATLVTPGEGVAEDAVSKVEALVTESSEAAATYAAWLANEAEDKGDEPEVSAVVKAAVKLAQGKAAKVGGSTRTGGTFTGERRDIGKHIAEAFADQPVGTFLTVAEIRKFKSTEYGDNPPSAGAISARLFPTSGKCTVEGVEPGQNEKSNKGAKKVA